MYFFNVTAPTEIYTSWPIRSRHDALPICQVAPVAQVMKHLVRDPPEADLQRGLVVDEPGHVAGDLLGHAGRGLVEILDDRSEEHTSELQSLMRSSYAVLRLKKKTDIVSTLRDTLTVLSHILINSIT